MFGKQMKRHIYTLYFGILFLFFIIILAIIMNHSFLVSVHGREKLPRTECYESIYVKAGDSLWSISNQYFSEEYRSVSNYMKRIMKINHMTSPDLNAGTYLVIPYFCNQ